MSGGEGVVVLSIDLELEIQKSDQRSQERLDEVRRSLVSETSRRGIPATWAVADPIRSAATESIVTSGAGHEIAVLGDRNWVGQGCGRQRLDRELSRRFDAARRAGIQVSTLALRNVDRVLDLDLLLDHGVTAIRGPAVATASLARKIGAPPIRFGIWQPPTAWRIPPQSRWWLPSPWLVRREIQRATGRGAIVHLDIDASGLIERGSEGLTAIESVLNLIAARVSAGKLRTATIASLASEQLRERDSTPSRSILRGAA